MKHIPTYRDFLPIAKLPEKKLGGLLLLIQRDGTPFAIRHGADIAYMYKSALPRREGFWSKARFWPEQDTEKRVKLALALELIFPTKWKSPIAEEVSDVLANATVDARVLELP